MKRTAIILAVLGLLLGGCARDIPEDTFPLEPGETQAATPQSGDPGSYFTDRDYRTEYEADARITFSGGEISWEGSGVEVAGTTVTLTREGTYVLSGTLENGTVMVDTDKQSKVQLVLEGASIHSETSAAIYVRQADKVFLTLAPNTENTLSCGESFVSIDENNIDGALFSKDDLTLNGSGSLTVLSPGGHGIVSKDELTVTGGSYRIQCAAHGLSGQDNVCIDGASLEIFAGKDGIQADNDEDAALGFVYIAGGSFVIQSEGDGISASSRMEIVNGSFTLTTGGGSENGETHTSENWGNMGGPMGGGRPGGMGGGRPGGMGGDQPGGMGGDQPGGMSDMSGQTTQEDSTSIKGLKAGTELLIHGGDFTLDCADDAVHANGPVTVSGGSFVIATGDDGFHADAALEIRGGTLEITESYEGLEGQSIGISGGNIRLTASDDGLNAAGGTDQSGFGGFRGGDMFAADSNCFIVISGGTLFVDAQGDGIDSNGNLTFSGGDVTVEGPTDGGNGPLDYAGTGSISGGTVRITGSVQMAQTLQPDGQGVLGVSVGNQSGGTAWKILDSQGNTVLSGQPEKAYSCIVVSAPDLVSGQTYTVQVGTQSGQLTAS